MSNSLDSCSCLFPPQLQHIQTWPIRTLPCSPSARPVPKPSWNSPSPPRNFSWYLKSYPTSSIPPSHPFRPSSKPKASDTSPQKSSSYPCSPKDLWSLFCRCCPSPPIGLWYCSSESNAWVRSESGRCCFCCLPVYRSRVPGWLRPGICHSRLLSFRGGCGIRWLFLWARGLPRLAAGNQLQCSCKPVPIRDYHWCFYRRSKTFGNTPRLFYTFWCCRKALRLSNRIFLRLSPCQPFYNQKQAFHSPWADAKQLHMWHCRFCRPSCAINRWLCGWAASAPRPPAKVCWRREAVLFCGVVRVPWSDCCAACWNFWLRSPRLERPQCGRSGWGWHYARSGRVWSCSP